MYASLTQLFLYKMVFLTGDCYGNFRWFGRRYIPEQEVLDRDSLLIRFKDGTELVRQKD